VPAAIPEALTAPLASIEDALERGLASLSLAKSLDEAIRYALLNGGKRVRPLLAWSACEALGVPGAASLPAGTAVELVHAFSLVHDDLPAMDDDELRRGRPTLHVYAGEAMAILAGDAMLSAAFDVLVRGAPTSELAARLIRELAGGAKGMICGQVYDTLGFSDERPDAERVEAIHRQKTGALIRAGCRMGAWCAIAERRGGSLPESDPPELGAITTYAEGVGLMFQIVDDLLDVEQTTELAGKRTGKDADADKLTWPGVFGVEESRKMVERLRNEAERAVVPLGERAAPLVSWASVLACRTA